MTGEKLLEISSNAVQEIRKIYNLDGPEIMEEAIEILKKWIMQENHILKKDFDSRYLERALIMSKGSIERTKKRIDGLCTMKTLMPHFFTINNSKREFEELLMTVNIIPLPVLTQDFYRVIIMRTRNANYTQQNLFMLMQYCIMILEYMYQHDYCKGFVFLDDFVDMNFYDFVTNLSLVHVQQFASIVLNGYGSRIKGVHIVSQSKAVDLFTNIINQFFSHKIEDRIYVYKNFDDLLDNGVPKHILPEEYGGQERSMNTLLKNWLDVIFSKENMDNLKLMSAAGTNEKLRQSDKFNEEYLGTAGSFRNLKVD